MSLERAIEIFTSNKYDNPQEAIDIIQRASSLDELSQIIRGTNSSSGQFVSMRMIHLFKGDPEFAIATLEEAKAKFHKYDFPEKIKEDYISEGGGEDVRTPISFNIQLGHYGNDLDIELLESALNSFYLEADQFLFEKMRAYITGSLN